jgi:hypothetical protein
VLVNNRLLVIYLHLFFSTIANYLEEIWMMTIDSPYCMHNEFTEIFDTDVYVAYIDDAITTNQAL